MNDRTMYTAQRKIVKELEAAFSSAATSMELSTVGDFAFVTMQQVSSDCKSQKTNVFRVGPKGGLKKIKQEFTA